MHTTHKKYRLCSCKQRNVVNRLEIIGQLSIKYVQESIDKPYICYMYSCVYYTMLTVSKRRNILLNVLNTDYKS